MIRVAGKVAAVILATVAFIWPLGLLGFIAWCLGRPLVLAAEAISKAVVLFYGWAIRDDKGGYEDMEREFRAMQMALMEKAQQRERAKREAARRN